MNKTVTNNTFDISYTDNSHLCGIPFLIEFGEFGKFFYSQGELEEAISSHLEYPQDGQETHI